MDDDDAPPGVPEWVVTFGDMMSLLLTFFIMLVSLSEIKQVEKYQALVESIKKQLGHDSSFASMVPGPVKPRNSLVQQVANLARAKRKDMMKGGAKVDSPTGENKLVQIIRSGTKTSVGTTIFLAEGSPELSDFEKIKLEVLAKKIIGKPHKIEVRGHTSRRPIPPGQAFKNHDELAFLRCQKVKAYLADNLGVKSARIRIAIGGADEPLHIGIDPALLKLNPRVDVFSLDEVYIDSIGSKKERAQRLESVPADTNF